MKKFFTLIAAALVAAGVNAQTLIDYPTSKTGTSISGTTTEGTVKIHLNADAVACYSLKNGYSSDGVCNDNYIKLETDGGFKAGDVLTVAGCVNNSDESKWGTCVFFTMDGDKNVTAVKTFENFINSRLVADDPVEQNYTLEADVDAILLGRSGNTGTNLTTIKVVRGGSAPVVQGKKLVDITGYNWLSSEYKQKEDGTWGNVYTRLTDPVLYDYNRYYYNAQNVMAVERTSSQHMRYTYNADGTVKTRENMTFAGSTPYVSTRYSYEYDAQGNMTKMTQESMNAEGKVTYTSGSKYSGYEKGEYTVMVNFSVTDGQEVDGYETRYKVVFNEAGQLVSKVQMNKNAETGEWDQPNTFTFNEYANGLLVKTTSGYYNATAEAGHEYDNVDTTISYEYNSDGTIKSRTEVTKTARYEAEVEYRYSYAELGADFVVKNVTCDGTIGNNEVYVKWDAVSGAEKYIVIYDNSEAEVEGKTEFITPLLADGEHQVAVQAVVGGEKKNISEFVKVNVKDEGNLPMENFQVVAAEKVDVESYGYVSQYYNLTLTWTVPEKASKITEYTVYVDKQNGESWTPSTKYTMGMPEAEKQDSYNDVNTWITNRNNFYWTTFEDYETNQDTWEQKSLGKGPTCKIWMTATYATGESQKSNVVEVNVYDLANGANAVSAVKTVSQEAAEVYNLAGQRVGAANGRQVYILREGNTVRKVIK